MRKIQFAEIIIENWESVGEPVFAMSINPSYL